MGLPNNMDCSLLGSDTKAGTVPMAVVPFSNRIYIYIMSSTLFVICGAIIFYAFKQKTELLAGSTYKISNTTRIISAFTTIIGIASIVFYNLYNNTPSTFNYLFFGMFGIIITFCLLAYLIVTDKTYLIDSLKTLFNGLGSLFILIYNIIFSILVLIKDIIINVIGLVGGLISDLVSGLKKYIEYIYQTVIMKWK